MDVAPRNETTAVCVFFFYVCAPVCMSVKTAVMETKGTLQVEWYVRGDKEEHEGRLREDVSRGTQRCKATKRMNVLVPGRHRGR